MGEARRRGNKEQRIAQGKARMLELAIKEYGGTRESLDAFIAAHYWTPNRARYYNVVLVESLRRKVLKFCDKLGIPLPPKPQGM